MTVSSDLSPPFPIPTVIKPRDPKTARKLARSCPGLGHVYAGDIRRGLLFLAGVDLPLVLGSLVLVAPWGSLRGAVALWILAAVITFWSWMDLRKLVRGTRSDYRMKDYNHWTVYVVIGFVPTLAVAMATAVAIRSTLFLATAAASDLPRIGITRGDYFVESKTAYQDQRPAIGDHVVWQGPPGSSRERFIGRITGLSGGPATENAENHPLVPSGCVEVYRGDGTEGRQIISEMAVSGKLVFRFWPLSRFGSLSTNGIP